MKQAIKPIQERMYMNRYYTESVRYRMKTFHHNILEKETTAYGNISHCHCGSLEILLCIFVLIVISCCATVFYGLWAGFELKAMRDQYSIGDINEWCNGVYRGMFRIGEDRKDFGDVFLMMIVIGIINACFIVLLICCFCVSKI
eukprot:569784_1